MKRIFLSFSALLLGFILFAPDVHIKAQTQEVSQDACLKGYASVFDTVDEIFASAVNPILEDPAIVDPALLFPSSLQTYQCHLNTVCSFVEAKVAGGDENFSKAGMEICGDTISGADGVQKEFTAENAMEVLGMNEQSLAGCNSIEQRADQLNIISQCRAFVKIKMRIESAKLATKMKASVRDKQIGAISKKFHEIHTRMNGIQESFPLTTLTQKFSATLKSVLGKISCTVSETETL